MKLHIFACLAADLEDSIHSREHNPKLRIILISNSIAFKEATVGKSFYNFPALCDVFEEQALVAAGFGPWRSNQVREVSHTHFTMKLREKT